MNYKGLGEPFKSDKITLYNFDNMELLKQTPDNYYQLSIVDPPYGMLGETFVRTAKGKYGAIDGTTNRPKISMGHRPNKNYFNELFRVSKNQMIFGMQYFVNNLYTHQCVIVWDKINGKSKFSDAEIIYTSFDFGVRICKIHNPSHPRIHPTQKPIKLYEWLLIKYAKENDKILDTHLGSGSIAIACHNLGFNLTACELNKDYFDASIKRFKEVTAQKDLF